MDAAYVWSEDASPIFFEFVYSHSAFEIKRGWKLYRLANSLWSRSIVLDEKRLLNPNSANCLVVKSILFSTIGTRSN